MCIIRMTNLPVSGLVVVIVMIVKATDLITAVSDVRTYNPPGSSMQLSYTWRGGGGGGYHTITRSFGIVEYITDKNFGPLWKGIHLRLADLNPIAELHWQPG